jgi:hypothetical protein
VIVVTRGVSALIGVATVPLVGLLAARMFGPLVGLFAAALFATAPYHALYAHIASTDIALTAGFALTMLAAFTCARRGDPRFAAVAGLAGGLTFAAKYTGLAAMVAVGWAILERAYAERAPGRAVLLLVVAALGFVAGVLLGCPPCVMSPGEVMAGMRSEYVLKTMFSTGYPNHVLTPTLGWYGRPYLYQLVAALPYVLGWPLYAVSLAGLVLAVGRHTLADRIVLVTLTAYFLSMGGSQVVFPRYLLPLFPGLVVLAARAVAALPIRDAGRLVVLAAVVVYSAIFAASQIARLSYDQQSGVARWIEASVRDQRKSISTTRVGYPGDSTADYYRLRRTLARRGLDVQPLSPRRWFKAKPDYLVIPEIYAIAVRRLGTDPNAIESLERLESGEAGYEKVARWRSTYLQSDWYARLDPGFAVDLWQGEIGFVVYARSPSGDAGDSAGDGTTER